MLDTPRRPILDALLSGLAAQGQQTRTGAQDETLRSYPISGTIDVVALAEAVESALGGVTSDDDDAKTPAELNATNDG